MWQLVAAPFLAAAALLVVAGAPKVVDPMPLARALRSARLPAGRALARAIAVGEVVVGVAALVHPGRATAALLAAAYCAFTGFVGLALARGGVLESCGCFGRADTPPTRTHLALTGALAVAALALALAPPAAPVWSAQALTRPSTLVLIGFAALVAVLGHAVLAVQPLTTPAAVRSAARATTPGRG
jgi:uncharacterized membrane protein YphA (DoxX/SURF4 family)